MNTTPLTPDSVLAAPTHPEQAPDAYDWRNDPQLSEKWKNVLLFTIACLRQAHRRLAVRLACQKP